MCDLPTRRPARYKLNGDVASLRSQTGQNQEAFAHILRFGEKHWSKVERGEEGVLREALPSIARALNYAGPPWDLLRDPGEWRATPDELFDYLCGAVRAYACVALYGMSGIGKSFTARRVCEAARTGDHFTLPPLWLQVGQIPDPSTLWASLCRHVGLDPDRGNRDVSRIHAAVEHQGKRLLVVADDLWKEWPVSELQLLSLPKPGALHVLYTTRHQSFADDLTREGQPGRSLEVPLLSCEEAVVLLEEGCGLARKQLCPLAEKLDYLPLSLVVAAGMIRKRAKGMGQAGEVVRQILDLDLPGRALMDRDLPLDRGTGRVRQILDLSYQLLSSDLQAAYHQLGSLPPDQLFRVSDLSELDIPVDFADELIDRSLLMRREEHGTVCCWMHDLVRSHARAVGPWE